METIVWEGFSGKRTDSQVSQDFVWGHILERLLTPTHAVSVMCQYDMIQATQNSGTEEAKLY